MNSFKYHKGKILKLDNRNLRLKKDLEFKPYRDESGINFIIEIGDLGIFADGLTKQSIELILLDEINFMWFDCACEKDEKLSKKSIEIKNNLLDTFEEINE